MHRLCAKIETNPNRPKFLCTVRGRGYSFDGAEPQVALGDVAEV